MKKTILSLLLVGPILMCAGGEITPYKFTDDEMGHCGGPEYTVPESAKYFVERGQKDTPDILFYYNKPKSDSFPIAIFCGGSSQRNRMYSAIHVHRYFLQEFLDLDCGLITLEQWGSTDQKIDCDEFWKHYTRTQRLASHERVIESLLKNPPQGWNGKFIFLGCSEGGPLVEQLTEKHSDVTLATISWSGAGALSWRDELWIYIKQSLDKVSEEDLEFPRTREEYDNLMDNILENPILEKEFMGMTYAYHADALSWPDIDYAKIKTPYLVVSGALDSFIVSSDTFVEKAEEFGIDVTYFRVEDMDHYIRNRPDIVQKSFSWLQETIEGKLK